MVFYNELSNNILFYWVDYNGFKNDYTENLKPEANREMESFYYRPWIFKQFDTRSKLFAFIRNEKVDVFEGKDFKAADVPTLHVVINDQGDI